MKKIFLILLCLVFVGAGVFAQSSTFVAKNIQGKGIRNGKPLVVAMDYADLVSEYVINLSEYAKFILQTAGAKVTITNSNMDLKRQDSNLDDFIQMKADVVILHAVDSEGSSPAVKRLNAAGIPVICVIRSVNDARMDLYISTSDNIRTGEKAAQWLVKKAAGQNVSFATFQGYMGASDAYLRAQGIDNVAKTNPNFAKAADYPCDWLPDKGMKALSDALSAHPDLWGIITHCDCISPGIASALQQANRYVPAGNANHIFWAGIDGAPYGLKMIRAGVMDVGVEQSPLTVGLLAAKAVLNRVAKGLPLGGVSVDVPTTYVTKDNVDDPGLWGNYDIKKASAKYLWSRTEEIWNNYLTY
jgi:ribose transport system substrate-binding protein